MDCKRADRAALLLRLMLGFVFIHHGAEKVLGGQVYGMIGWFEHMGWPRPALLAWMAGLGEFLGGIAVLLGFGTRIGAFLIACVMTVATTLVHLPQDTVAGEVVHFPNTLLTQNFQFPFALLAAAVALLLLGGGVASVDRIIWRKLQGPPTSDDVARTLRRAGE